MFEYSIVDWHHNMVNNYYKWPDNRKKNKDFIQHYQNYKDFRNLRLQILYQRIVSRIIHYQLWVQTLMSSHIRPYFRNQSQSFCSMKQRRCQQYIHLDCRMDIVFYYIHCIATNSLLYNYNREIYFLHRPRSLLPSQYK